MPRILYLINSFNSGGAERGILSLIDTGFFEGTYLELVAIHKGEHPILDELKKRDWQGTIHYCSPAKKLTIKAMLKTAFYILGRLVKTKPKFLMLSLTQSNLIGRCLAILFPKLKVISFEHNTNLSKKIYITLLKHLSWRVNYCFYDNLLTYRAVKKSIYYKNSKAIGMYIPLHAISTKATKKTSYQRGKPPHILSVGRLNEQKNYSSAIEAITILKSRGITAQLSIAGIGEDLKALKDLSEEQEVTDQINFMGFVSDWISLKDKTDIFLLSSIREGMSIVTVEAMAAAFPIVATNVGGIQDYGKDNLNMVKALSPTAEDIANALEKVIADDKLRKNIGKQAAKDAYAEFGAEKVGEALKDARQKVFFS